MKNIRPIYSIVTILLVAMFISCNNKSITFNDKEIELINRYKNSIMPLKTINTESDSIFLREISTPLTKEDLESSYFQELTHSMLMTVNNPENEGVGIAAPQVGIGKQLIAVQRLDKEGEPFEFYVNPKIISTCGDKEFGGEGCLSVPGMRGDVERYRNITIEYNDIENFEIKTETIEGFTAVIFQHEIDHLNGTLYIDKAENITNK
ncbi:MAG: peptide deformylase [Muribaculaceae bacterium]|nr:peptide deformylase [Muribaculaceae bacterium]